MICCISVSDLLFDSILFYVDWSDNLYEKTQPLLCFIWQSYIEPFTIYKQLLLFVASPTYVLKTICSHTLISLFTKPPFIILSDLYVI